MTSQDIIEQFEKTWFYNRQISSDFLDAIPEDRWNYTHHTNYATLDKQFRHMACVYGVYIDGFRHQAVDFKKKHSHYLGPLEKNSIKEDLRNKDEQLKNVLNDLKKTGIENFKLDFFGVSMSFTEYTHVLIQHECMHIGIWSNAAASAGFELPKSWKSDWGFE
jgi:uncharacterized damage-inducible protein DinB